MHMRRNPRGRTYEFNIVHGVLERTARFVDGHAYTHRCSLQVFETAAWAIEEAGSHGVTTDELADATGEPSTQINVALEFMKDRCGIHMHGRRNYMTGDFLFEDAMAEWHCLAEEPHNAFQ